MFQASVGPTFSPYISLAMTLYMNISEPSLDPYCKEEAAVVFYLLSNSPGHFESFGATLEILHNPLRIRQ